MRALARGESHTPAEAEAWLRAFLAANPSVRPDVEVRWEGDHRLKCRGYYRDAGTRGPRPTITMFEAQATRPGTGYSWPGHRSDRTVAGVLAHELGHHVHASLPDLDRCEVPRERPVSSYEDAAQHVGAERYAERVAETVRLFVLNPDLLARARPARYAALIRVGLAPIEARGWREVLGPAIPERMLRTLAGWAPAGALDGAAQQSLTLGEPLDG